MPGLEQDVLRLDIPVHDVAAVGEAQCIRHFPRDLQRVLQRKLLLSLQAAPQRFALHERHHVVEEPVGLARVVERQDVGVCQAGRDLDLAEKPLGAERRRDLTAEHLDRDGAAVFPVPSEIDGRHASAAQLALEVVAVGERRAEAGERVGQRGPGARDSPS